MFMWPKFGNSSISMRELIITSFWTGTRYGLENLHQCGKRVKTKSQKVLGFNSYVCRSYREKTGRGLFAPPPPS